jgi:hypothetical protein
LFRLTEGRCQALAIRVPTGLPKLGEYIWTVRRPGAATELVAAGLHLVLGGVGCRRSVMGDRALSDAELVTAALGGDASCLGLVLERHRADMRAVAVARLGYGPSADDAVQDAMVTALRRLPELRYPAKVGPWLRAIVRNACRMQVWGLAPRPCSTATSPAVRARRR